MWNNGMFNTMRPGMPMNPNWAPPNFQQQFNQWPMNQQWGQQRMPLMPFNNAPGWNQPRMPQNLYSQPPNPPLPSNGPKPPAHAQQPVPPPRLPTQPPPPVEQQPPPPPPPTEKGQPPPPLGIEKTKDPVLEKKTVDAPNPPKNISKLNLSAPPPPPPPEENKKEMPNINQKVNVNNQVSTSCNQKTNVMRNDVRERGGGRGNLRGGRGNGNQGGSYGNNSPFPRGRGFGTTNLNARGRNNQFGNNFFQDDNSEYDDGFNSNLDEVDSQYSGFSSHEATHGDQSNRTNFQSDWKCSDNNCSETNVARRTECRKCGKSKDCDLPDKTPLRSGDWKCAKCEEINFAKREMCRKCNSSKNVALTTKLSVTENKVTGNKAIDIPANKSNQNTKLENFDKMFGNWEENYEKWKTSNAENPDRAYVETYMAQMEAMRIQLLDKRKGLNSLHKEDRQDDKGTAQVSPDTQNEEERKQKMMKNWQSQSGIVEQSFQFIEETTDDVKEDISAKELAKKILGENSDDSDEETTKTTTVKAKRSRWGDEEEQQEPKRNRWEIHPSDIVDIQDWRRRPETENSCEGNSFRDRPNMNFVNNEVKDRNEFQSNFGQRQFPNSNMPEYNNQSPRFSNGQGQYENQDFRRDNNQRFMRGNMNIRGRGRVGHGSLGEGNRFNNTPEYENFWKPAAVTDYSANKNMPNSRRDVFVQREFKPETFDYSHGAQRASNTVTKERVPEKQLNSWNNGPRNSPRPDRNSIVGAGEKTGKFHTPPPERSSPPVPVKPAGNRVMIDSIITPPGRSTRPPKMVIILRGLPGSGKSHLARLIKEKELEHGGEQPRTLALDDYFDVDGEYEFDPEMEDLYRSNFIKSFKKNVDGGYFQFLIVDSINSEVDHFRSMWSHAKQNGFEVYICDVECDASTAAGRNVHGRSEKDVLSLAQHWEDTPPHMNTLDARGLLQDDAIEHFEMGEASDDVKEDTSEISQTQEDEEADSESFLRASKWEILDKEEKMARLDGTTEKLRSKLAEHHTIEDWLEFGDDYNRPAQQGKKRVRWADIEERKSQARVKELGFVVGQTNWANQRDADSAAINALASTKIIPNRFQSEFHN